VRIASRPRSDKRHGANVLASQSPSGDCAHYGIGTSGFHQFQDIIDLDKNDPELIFVKLPVAA
jgi:hypothetical protein